MEIRNERARETVSSTQVDFGEVCLYKGKYLMAINIGRADYVEPNEHCMYTFVDPNDYVDLSTGDIITIEGTTQVIPVKGYFGIEG